MNVTNPGADDAPAAAKALRTIAQEIRDCATRAQLAADDLHRVIDAPHVAAALSPDADARYWVAPDLLPPLTLEERAALTGRGVGGGTAKVQ